MENDSIIQSQVCIGEDLQCIFLILGMILPLLILWSVWWIRKKNMNRYLMFFLNVAPLAIAACEILIPQNQNWTNGILITFYFLSIAGIEWLIDQYKNLMPQTKESYEFNNRYASIQEQWDLIKKKGEEVETKRLFIDESLRNLEDTVTRHDVYYNPLSDKKTDDFATIVGSLSKDYILLCSNQNTFYNAIFASLYKYLFSEYKTNVLSPIQPNSNESADLIIPEFVSNGLTQIIIDKSDIVEYQYNTSVSTIEDFQDNVKEDTELKGKIPQGYLKRIIITREITNPTSIDIDKFKKILSWHEKSNVELKFISESDAKNVQRTYSGIDRLDFSIIKLRDNGYFILGADKNTYRLIAGEKHEMYSVKCISSQERPDGDRLFQDLWSKALKGEVDQSNNVVFKK